MAMLVCGECNVVFSGDQQCKNGGVIQRFGDSLPPSYFDIQLFLQFFPTT